MKLTKNGDDKMKKIGIITDSHSSISREDAEALGIMMLPMPFYVGGECYYEGVTLSRDEFFEKLEAGMEIGTSQASPAAVMEIWDEGLKQYDEILYMPLSSGLSGSCSVAQAMAQDEPYEGKVFVVDHGRVSTPLHQLIIDTKELIAEGYSAREIRDMLESDRDNMVIYIGVQTLEYLKKGGRITPAAAALGTVLNIKPILKVDTGKLGAYKKCRGFNKAKKIMIDTIREEIETKYKEQYEDGRLCMMAAASASPEETAAWVKEIETAFPGKKVLCDYLSMGVSCHTGAGALGIGFSIKPVRE